jgi:putative polymerase
MSLVAAGRLPRMAATPLAPLRPSVVFAVMLGAMTFHMALCFVNTKIGGVGNGAIIGCEVVIVGTVLLLSYPAIDHPRFLVVSSILLYLVLLAVLRTAFHGESVQIKPVRDLLIPVAFFFFGMRAADIRRADLLVGTAAAVVVGGGIVEYAFPDRFTELFNIARFYVERGAMNSGQSPMSSNLFISGIRPDVLGGRNLLPFLGDHRISSVFLEPISAGNFGIIVFMWALTRSLARRRMQWALFAAGATMIILSDSRFGAMFCIVATGIALLPPAVGAVVAGALPAVALTALVVLPDHLEKMHVIGNGFVSRLVLSGHFIGALDLQNWFGLETPEFQPFDSGYAYSFIGFGVAGAAVLWLVFWLIGGNGRQFRTYRNLVGAYYGVLLCVSNSPYTIKTASLLWFLLGVLSSARDPAWSPARRAMDRHGAPARAAATPPRPSPGTWPRQRSGHVPARGG